MSADWSLLCSALQEIRGEGPELWSQDAWVYSMALPPPAKSHLALKGLGLQSVKWG